MNVKVLKLKFAKNKLEKCEIETVQLSKFLIYLPEIGWFSNNKDLFEQLCDNEMGRLRKVNLIFFVENRLTFKCFIMC